MSKRQPRIIEGTRKLKENEMIKILKDGEYAVISTIGKDGYPYGFPMSYVLIDDYIYFHCALEGHKIDNIRYNNKVSFCLVGDTKLIPEDLDTAYESIIVFGKTKEVSGEEKLEALIQIVNKYSKGFEMEGKMEAKRDQDITGVFKISIESMTGKIRRK